MWHTILAENQILVLVKIFFSSCAGEENVNYVYRINLGQSSPGKLITIYKRKSKCSLIFVRSLCHPFVLMK